MYLPFFCFTHKPEFGKLKRFMDASIIDLKLQSYMYRRRSSDKTKGFIFIFKRIRLRPIRISLMFILYFKQACSIKLMVNYLYYQAYNRGDKTIFLSWILDFLCCCKLDFGFPIIVWSLYLLVVTCFTVDLSLREIWSGAMLFSPLILDTFFSTMPLDVRFLKRDLACNFFEEQECRITFADRSAWDCCFRERCFGVYSLLSISAFLFKTLFRFSSSFFFFSRFSWSNLFLFSSALRTRWREANSFSFASVRAIIEIRRLFTLWFV